MTTSSSVPDNGGDHSGGGGDPEATYTDDAFSTYLYTGTGAAQDIENGIDLAGEGGMVWIKSRTDAYSHSLHDTTASEPWHFLQSNNADARATDTANENLTISAFNSSGFVIGSGSGVNNGWGGNGSDFTSWTFRKAPKFFDVVTWTGDGVAGREIPHNLGVEPGMVIVKSTSNDSNWIVTHASIPDHYLTLDTADSKESDVKMVTTDSTISWTGSDVYYNRLGREYVAYVFAHDDSDESMIKCGSFSSPAKTTFEIDLGFEPEFFLVKKTSGSGHWYLIDSMRGFNSEENAGPQNRALQADTSNSESADEFYRPTARGVQGWQLSAHDYIYLAIRRPNKPAEEFEPEELFQINSLNNDGHFESGWPVDFALQRNSVSGTQDNWTMARLLSGKRMKANESAAIGNETNAVFDYQDRWYKGKGPSADNVSWMWRRAPGFMDVVAYTGTQVAREIPHNLESVPEMMWVKARTGGSNSWRIGGSKVGNGTNNALALNTDQAMAINNTYWNNTAQTSSVFSLGASAATNGAGVDYIAYLFASVPGISKVGSYTGNGGLVGVDCGFTNGARFVLIKRTDAAGDWMVFDTLRGITNSDSPMLALNTTNAQVNGPYIRGWSTGFRAGTGSGGGETPACIDGAEYIYYAIA
jgi:hypothetical protein